MKTEIIHCDACGDTIRNGNEIRPGKQVAIKIDTRDNRTLQLRFVATVINSGCVQQAHICHPCAKKAVLAS